MTIRSLLMVSLLALAPSLQAASVSSLYRACNEAVSAELGEGRLRAEVQTSRRTQGDMTHWINVRFRPSGADATQRMRVQCHTDSDGAVSSLDLDAGAWRKMRPNQAPKPVE